MQLVTLINLISLGIGFVAGLFFCVGSILMTKYEISKISATYWGENPHLQSFFVSTKADYVIGACFLCISFVGQFVSAIPNMFGADDVISITDALQVIGAIVISSGCLGWFAREKLRRKLLLSVVKTSEV